MLSLSESEKRYLLTLVRDVISRHLRGEKPDPEIPDSDILRKPCGAFVTLKKQGQLRGCIGQISADNPLYLTITEMAVSAATRDPRFEPVSEDELDEIDIELSVLSPFELINDVSVIEVGVHGLLIRSGYRQGLLLPQVATEYNWSREEFLQHTCMKAGLDSSAWKLDETEIEIFSAVVFGEND